MKKSVYVTYALVSSVFCILFTTGCEKSNLNEELNYQPKTSYDYQKASVSQVLFDAGFEISSWQEDKSADPHIEVIYDGVFIECGDGSADCIAPRNLCAIIITADRGVADGNNILFFEGELIKALQPNPVKIEFSSLTLNNSDPIANCSASVNAILNWEENDN